MDLDDYKERQRATWGKGDWSKIAHRTQPAADLIVARTGVSQGARVLDVAAGTGNIAVAAAKAGAVVTAIDLAPKQVEAGKRRTSELGIAVDWREADMEALPFEDGSFDVVGSAFGILFAPHPEIGIAEMFRVLKTGGNLGLANWERDSWQSTMTEIMTRYIPPPEGRPDQYAFGHEQSVQAMLRPYASQTRFEHHSIWTEFDSARQWWESSSANSPPLVAASESLDPSTFEMMGQEMMDAVEKIAEAGPPIKWSSAYLITLATKK